MLLLLVATGGCATDKKVISQAADVHTELNPAVLTDPALRDYLQAVGDRVIEQAAKASARGDGPKKHFSGDNQWMFSQGMKFHFVNSKTLNAFTTGGEHMYIYTALFLQCKTEDELAAVVAHEYAHVYGRHVQKGMDRQIGSLVVAGAGAAAGAAVGGKDHWAEGAAAGGGAAFLVGSLANLGFTREDEDEADKYGFKFYTRSGWDPAHFGDFFQQMVDKGQDVTPELLSSHPSLRKRVENARRRASELGPDAAGWRRPNVAGPERFAELQNRARRLGKTAPSDSSLENSQSLLQALPRSCVTPLEPDDMQQARKRLNKGAS